MTQTTYPPPPPPKPNRIRPNIISKLALVHLIISVILIIVGAWNLSLCQTLSIPGGIICIVLAVVNIVYFLGLYTGKSWVLWLGYDRYLKNKPEVMAYFELPLPVYSPVYPPPAPPPAAPSPCVTPSPPPTSAPSSSAAPSPIPDTTRAPRMSTGMPPTAPACPACKQTLIFVHQYNRWYCQNCKKYV